MRRFLLVLSLAFVCGCSESGDSLYDAGKEHLAGGRREEARLAFEGAVASGCSRMAEAHFELGRLAQSEHGGLPLALWHFRMAKELYRGGGVKGEDIAAAVSECSSSLLRELTVRSGGLPVGGDLRLKVELLEEHARKQSRWLEELRRENALMRRQLSERE